MPRKPDSLGLRLKVLRVQHGWTQDDVASRVAAVVGRDLDRASVSHWERDEVGPRVEHLRALATVFDVTVGDLIDEVPAA